MSTTIKQTLDFRQSQQLVMTPQMQQAVKLLQLNNLELAEYLEEEVAQNPLLEKAEPQAEGDSTGSEDAGQTTDQPADNMEQAFESGWDQGGASDGVDYTANNNFADVGKGGTTHFGDDDRTIEDTLRTEKTLRAHLLEQLVVDVPDIRDQMLGSLLIDRLDEQGYLREDLAQLTEALNIEPARLDSVLQRLRKFDPAGVFAHDLADCLALQLEDAGKLDDVFKIILANLQLVANRENMALARKAGIDVTELTERLAVIRHLNPKPAADFDSLIVQTAVPDVLMKRLPREMGGGWRVELNNDTLPKVLLNQTYATDVLNRAKNKEEQAYIQSQFTAASWLVRALDQRAQTILKVAAAIIEAQDGFFLYGIEFLKPLTLREIAEEIDMHESTVSRVTTNKYIGTPRGLFEMKFFFSSGVGTTESGGQFAAEAVKARIKMLVDAETAENILSDDEIVALLKAEGIDLARRTVAKYRDMMNIPASSVRRRQKRG